jgi:hypothetical protein
MKKWTLKDQTRGVPRPLEKIYPDFIQQSVRELLEKHAPKDDGRGK